MPRPMKPRPNGSDVQNTVDRSTSVSVGVWMSAAPSPRSAKSGTKIANAMTMPAIPNSDGTSRRARMSRTASLVACVTRRRRSSMRHRVQLRASGQSARRIPSVTGYGRSRCGANPPPPQEPGASSRTPRRANAVNQLIRLPRLETQQGVARRLLRARHSSNAPPHRAETTSRHAAQLRCLWNGISKSDANDIAKATAAARQSRA